MQDQELKTEYKYIQLKDLSMKSQIRDLRTDVILKLKDRIKEKGYNPAKPLSIINDEKDNSFIIADGYHRFNAVKDLFEDSYLIPCILYKNKNLFELAINCNKDEDTYSPMDLFDYIDIIKQLKDQKLTQEKIGEIIGFSREIVKFYFSLINNIGTTFLNLARTHEESRVPQNGTNVPTYHYTEGWFRNSGLYSLSEKLQLRFFYWFKKKDFKPGKKEQEKYISMLLSIQEQELILKELNPDIENYKDKLKELLKSIHKGEYSTERFKQVIEKLNLGAKSKALFGVDCLEELKKLEDNKIDLIITDPPWGVDFIPSRNTENPVFDKGIEETLNFLSDVFKELKRVTKENAHLYVFFPTVFYTEFKNLLEKYFFVYPIPLIWEKNNHNPCDFKNRYASIYETIFFCKKSQGDNRKLNANVSPDVLKFSKPTDKYHDCQKPIDLLEYLIKNSSSANETVCDPFAGSGSALLASKKCNRDYIGFEKEKTYESPFKKLLEDLNK